MRIDISWLDPHDDFTFTVRDADENLVAANTTTPPSDNEGGGSETSRTVFVPSPSGSYTVRVVYERVVDSGYSGTATFVSTPGAVFEQSAMEFAPATVVSAHFLGAEPQATIERTHPGAPSDATDPDRIFIDWPLSTRAQIGQLSRSLDGGDSFRLLFDPLCPQRSRPNCGTGGGGDSDNEVNPFTGHVFFADQEGGVGHEAIASSTDHGDTFPLEREHAVVNSVFGTDREWLSATDPSFDYPEARKIEALLTYWVPPSIFVQGIDDEGNPVPQPVAQITGPTAHAGPPVVDLTNGPGRGWIYVPHNQATSVSTAPVSQYDDPEAWERRLVDRTVRQEGFLWLALDTSGNAFLALTLNDGLVYYSASRIDDPANDPTASPPGRPGTKWSPPISVTPPEIGSVDFPAIVAGDEGRIAIAFMGTEDFIGPPEQAGDATKWDVYVANISNALALDGPPVVRTAKVSHRFVTKGPVADGGELLDFLDVGLDDAGRIGVAFMDNNSAFGGVPNDGDGSLGKPFVHFAKQIAGRSLLSGGDIDVTVPLNARADASGDATWPNTAAGALLPSLDVREASLHIEGDKLVAVVPLAAGSAESMQEDLARYDDESNNDPAADRLLYTVRFATEKDLYHLSMQSSFDGSREFFGGKLDENDRIAHGGTVVMASYRADESFRVEGSVDGDDLVFRALLSQLGIAEGSELFGVTAFSMAGPAASDESLFNPMRTIDATPPFDAVLTEAPSPGVDCTPEEEVVSILATHDFVCFAHTPENSPLTGTRVAVEAIGASDPDASDSPSSPDLFCITDSTGACSIEHGISGDEGTTTYRVWIDADGSDATVEADLTEGRDETAEPGSQAEPDHTDVVEAVAQRFPALVELSPAEATARPGSGQTVTATVTDATGAPVEGAEVEWFAAGQGRLQDSITMTNAQGRATATAISNEHGNLTVNAITPKCSDDGDCVGTAILHWGPASCDVFGTDGNETLQGTEESETICGFEGVDLIMGGGGDDRLVGGRGHDALLGDEGDDVLLGGSGRDVVEGGRGKDLLRGGRGGDKLRGGIGADRLRGGRGKDLLRGGRGRDKLRGGIGADRLRGGRGNDFLFGGVGADIFIGGAEDDELRGGRGPDRLRGRRGNDDLFGGRGLDRLRGGPGNDLLFGGRGQDHLRGGPGADKLDGGPRQDFCRPGRGKDETTRCE